MYIYYISSLRFVTSLLAMLENISKVIQLNLIQQDMWIPHKTLIDYAGKCDLYQLSVRYTSSESKTLFKK